MPRYKFTSSDCRKGGKSRAKQAADYRRINPTSYEKQVRDVLDCLGVSYSPEYPLQDTTKGIDFYLDIAIIKDGSLVSAIEIDGSNDWHNPSYTTSKNAAYDELKAQLLYNLDIPLLRLPHYKDQQKIILAIRRFLESAIVQNGATARIF